jgi:hypothetical protein
VNEIESSRRESGGDLSVTPNAKLRGPGTLKKAERENFRNIS